MELLPVESERGRFAGGGALPLELMPVQSARGRFAGGGSPAQAIAPVVVPMPNRTTWSGLQGNGLRRSGICRPFAHAVYLKLNHMEWDFFLQKCFR
jgi:hypothetical protein